MVWGNRGDRDRPGVVEVGVKGEGVEVKRISWVRLRRRETVEGGGKRGLEGNKERENRYGWDCIFSGEEEGQLVVEGNYIFFHDRGSVFSQWARLGFRVGVNDFFIS